MVELARSKGLDARVAAADALPFEAGTFDLVYSFKVLDHVREIDRALKEIARVTRPGGRAFIEVYNRHSLRYVVRRLRGGHEIAPGIDDNQVFVRFDSPEEAESRLPEELALLRLHGVRVFTLLPRAIVWPVVGSLLPTLEAPARSGPPRRLGGV